jgi:hypothetical protein
MENFTLGLQALILDIHLFVTSIFANKVILGFLSGTLLTTLLTLLIITKDPKAIPAIIRHSQTDAFMKLVQEREQQHQNGTIGLSYANFAAMYIKVRTIMGIAMIAFFVMVATIALTITV